MSGTSPLQLVMMHSLANVIRNFDAEMQKWLYEGYVEEFQSKWHRLTSDDKKEAEILVIFLRRAIEGELK